jgi:hypothetical protein
MQRGAEERFTFGAQIGSKARHHSSCLPSHPCARGEKLTCRNAIGRWGGTRSRGGKEIAYLVYLLDLEWESREGFHGVAGGLWVMAGNVELRTGKTQVDKASTKHEEQLCILDADYGAEIGTGNHEIASVLCQV